MGLKFTKPVKKPDADATITQSTSSKGATIAESVTNEKVPVAAFDTPAAKVTPIEPLCTVGYEASYTHNLGNYCSARVAVMITIPCPPAEVDEAYSYAQTWVDKRLEKEVEQLNKQTG